MKLEDSILKRIRENLWEKYLYLTDEKNINVERVNSIGGITNHETLEYVLKTLHILSEESLDNNLRKYVERTLQWSEVAKCGNKFMRNKWTSNGYNLDIHNLGSADIYKENSKDDLAFTHIVYILIQTHGLIGQYLRGEVLLSKNIPLLSLLNSNVFTKDELRNILIVLNKCIIKAISDNLWSYIRGDVISVIDRILNNDLKEDNTDSKLLKLFPNGIYQKKYSLDERIKKKFEEMFFLHDFWYVYSALNSFTFEEIAKIFSMIYSFDRKYVDNISFQPLAGNIYYDYEGKKKINIYKKRVIENFLKYGENEHVSFEIIKNNNTLLIDFKFTSACEKLIDFCVEAERSGVLTYEKSITMLFDLFNLRKDEFDRLNNEEKYLNTMNNAATSTKTKIVDYINGDVIVDVGSGGGVMLDLLEEKYPLKKIIGTDISSNVIEVLNQKRQDELHNWSVKRHNFLESEMDSCDTVIFSSILHEIFSYSEFEGKKFNINSVKTAIKNAYNSLSPNGRIIIRDGIKTNSSEKAKLYLKEKSGKEFFVNFIVDFKGLPEIIRDFEYGIDEKGEYIIGDINYIREFMYTYTWGQESYAHEVNEQFGYFTLNEFKSFILESLNGKIIVAEEFLEEGYVEHLSPLLSLTDLKGNEINFPNSNCIIVIEKKCN